jgi:2-methylisocitrate lyase-like PEP mutase family enzyme
MPGPVSGQHALERAVAFVEAGADGIFPEAITDLSAYRRSAAAVKVPVLANITVRPNAALHPRGAPRR